MPMITGAVRGSMWWPMLTRIWSIPIWLQDAWMLRYKMRLLPAKVSLSNPCGKDFAFAGPSVKDKKYFGDGTAGRAA